MGLLTLKDQITLDTEAASGNTIQQAAARVVEPLIAAYTEATNGSGSELESLTDLLVDLRHWADQKQISFTAAVQAADGHHYNETNGPPNERP